MNTIFEIFVAIVFGVIVAMINIAIMKYFGFEEFSIGLWTGTFSTITINFVLSYNEKKRSETDNG
jgi:hypothetical protein